MTPLPLLDRASLANLHALCVRAIENPPTRTELDDSLFAPDQPAIVRGHPDSGVVATVQCHDGTHIRLLVVDPTQRGRGYGHALVGAAEEDARAAASPTLTVGADPPYFLWPGVHASLTELLCLLERHHYSRIETNFDMVVDLADLPANPKGHLMATAEHRSEVNTWMATHWPNWQPEVLRALDKGNLVIAHTKDADDLAAICAFEVNRGGFLGPVAVRPDLIGRGMGKAVLLGALHELRRRGRDRTSVVWVGPVVPYAAVGGRVSDVYFVYRRELR